MVRTGADRAQVDAVFRIENPSRRLMHALNAHDLRIEDGALVLSRVVTADGRSRAYASGTPVPLSTLAALGDELVDLHGQHEHQSLLKPDLQLDLLDGFAGTSDGAAALAEKVRALREIDRTLGELESDDRERARRLEFRRFEVNEISAANLTPGEEEELRARRNLITNAEQIVTLASDAYASLYESQGASAIDQVNVAARALRQLTEIDGGFGAVATELETIREELEETARRVRQFTGNIDFDPVELNALNERLALIGNLKRKYGDTIDEILAYQQAAIEEIERYEQRDQRLAELQAKREELILEARQDAESLSLKRRKAASQLDKQVTAALHDLGMKGGLFRTQLEPTDLGIRGIDRVEFLLSANPGEKPKPLRFVASGGEISRVMLAIKTVFADADEIPTLVFDEIDAGVGGAMAGKIAAKLRELARTHQVLCVTHLPAIAASAETHFRVSKGVAEKRTTALLAHIEGEARVEEIARLLDGTLAPVSIEHARSLLKGIANAHIPSGKSRSRK